MSRPDEVRSNKAEEKPSHHVATQEAEPIRLADPVPKPAAPPAEIDPEYASDDEAVKVLIDGCGEEGNFQNTHSCMQEAIRLGKKRNIKARDVLLVLVLIVIAIAVVIAVVILGVKLGAKSGNGKKGTIAIILAAVLFAFGIVGFGVQEWRFRCGHTGTYIQRLKKKTLFTRMLSL